MPYLQAHSQQGVFDTTKSNDYLKLVANMYTHVNKVFKTMEIPVSTETKNEDFKELLFGCG